MEITKNLSLIEEQKSIVFGQQPEIKLARPCQLNDGIISHSEFEKNRFKVIFEQSSSQVHFFIPASGAGSRMFKFLYQFLFDPDDASRSQTERFFNTIESFAFFNLLPYDIKKRVREYDIDIEEFISYILLEKGLGLGTIPKGLVPFHQSRAFVLNAFQEHVIQGLRMKEDEINFHFTINKEFENKIEESLTSICNLTGCRFHVNWSEQDPKTNSVAFIEGGETISTGNGTVLTRPSGHGALLENLNQIDGDIIFVKNIDNIQHESKADDAVDTLKYLGGILTHLKEELKATLQEGDIRRKLQELNTRYQFLPISTNFLSFSEEEITGLIYRPMRVCGMVKNEGQPGGGPFWIEEDGALIKQIVEKSQIGNDESQYKLMVQSQYFNPVMMALSTKDIDGNKLDLNEFSDPSKYFIVEKSFKGNDIKFMERPGLWNGSMADWFTIFVEIPSETFTPVKTVLDLLSSAHRE